MEASALILLLAISNPIDDLRRFPDREYISAQVKFSTSSRDRFKADLDPAERAKFVPAFNFLGQGGVPMVAGGGVSDGTWCSSPFAFHSPRRARMEEALAEAEYCLRCWTLLASAADPSESDSARHDSLVTLRSLIGEANYAAGQMPPAAPYWAFTLR